MFKNKQFMSGLGIGLILGAALLQLMLAAAPVDTPASREGADAAILDRLRADSDKLGYQLLPKNAKVHTLEELEQIRAKAAEEERDKWAEQPAQNSEVARAVYISDRMDAFQTAELLALAGIWPDSGGLVRELTDKRLTTRIRAGAYQFQPLVTLEEIIAQITIPAQSGGE